MTLETNNNLILIQEISINLVNAHIIDYMPWNSGTILGHDWVTRINVHNEYADIPYECIIQCVPYIG